MRRLLLYAASAFYVLAGVNHFRQTDSYLKIMPPYVPQHLAMVYVSGLAEIAGGVGLALPWTRKAAAWGLIALLVAVFPANLYMAKEQIQVIAHPLPAWVLWGRLPLQGLLIWWIVWCKDLPETEKHYPAPHDPGR